MTTKLLLFCLAFSFFATICLKADNALDDINFECGVIDDMGRMDFLKLLADKDHCLALVQIKPKYHTTVGGGHFDESSGEVKWYAGDLGKNFSVSTGSLEIIKQFTGDKYESPVLYDVQADIQTMDLSKIVGHGNDGPNINPYGTDGTYNAIVLLPLKTEGKYLHALPEAYLVSTDSCNYFAQVDSKVFSQTSSKEQASIRQEVQNNKVSDAISLVYADQSNPLIVLYNLQTLIGTKNVTSYDSVKELFSLNRMHEVLFTGVISSLLLKQVSQNPRDSQDVALNIAKYVNEEATPDEAYLIGVGYWNALSWNGFLDPSNTLQAAILAKLDKDKSTSYAALASELKNKRPFPLN